MNTNATSDGSKIYRQTASAPRVSLDTAACGKPLGQQLRPIDDTLSAWAIIKSEFFRLPCSTPPTVEGAER